MSELTQRLSMIREKKARRADTDPDLCKLQALWVRAYGDERGFEPVLKAFRDDPHARLEVYVARYIR